MLGGALGGAAVFWAVSALFGSSALALMLIPRGWPAQHGRGAVAPNAKAPTPLLWLITRPGVRAVLLAVGVECFGLYLSLTYAGALLRERLALAPSGAGLTVALFGFGGLVFVAGGKPLLRRFGSGQRAGAGGAALCAGFVMLGLIHGLPAAAMALFAIGLGFLLMHNVLRVAASTVAPDAVATSLSLFAATATLAQAVGAAAAPCSSTVRGPRRRAWRRRRPWPRLASRSRRGRGRLATMR